jgi:hypothetical protein
MNETLISACQMFLIPATILFAAVGVPNGRGLKLLICLMGTATSGLWFYRVWYWAGLSVMDRRTALGLAGLYVLAWIFTFLIHLKNMASAGYNRR